MNQKKLIKIALVCFLTILVFVGMVEPISDSKIYDSFSSTTNVECNKKEDLRETKIMVDCSEVETIEPVIEASNSSEIAPIEKIKEDSVAEAVTETNDGNTDGMKHLGTFKAYAYCSCEKCCGKWANGITAMGTTAEEGRTIAVDPNVIPLGTDVYIDGYGWYIAEDTGSGIDDYAIDVFHISHEAALQWGIKSVDIYVEG